VPAAIGAWATTLQQGNLLLLLAARLFPGLAR
jgi:hypothetical protein